MNEVQNNSRIKVLDAFRGLAVIAVVLFHYTHSYGPKQDWFAYGKLGVEFFFVISGFVIFMTLEKCRGVLDFFLRRFSRLYPAFLVCVTITSLFGLVVGQDVTPRQYFANLSMAAPHFGEKWIDSVYWSLLVEVKYYACVAGIYFFFRRLFVYGWAVFCILTTQLHHLSNTLSWFVPVNLFCYFSLGMGFYLVFMRKRLDVDSAILFVLSFALYVAYWRDETLAFNLIVAGFVAIFSLFLAGKLDWLSKTGLQKIGLISYSIYLIHRVIGIWFIENSGLSWGISVPLVGIIIILLSAGLYHLVEIQGQQLLRGMSTAVTRIR